MMMTIMKLSSQNKSFQQNKKIQIFLLNQKKKLFMINNNNKRNRILKFNLINNNKARQKGA